MTKTSEAQPEYERAARSECRPHDAALLAARRSHLAELILEQFGREDWREPLNGLGRREAEYLAASWLDIIDAIKTPQPKDRDS